MKSSKVPAPEETDVPRRGPSMGSEYMDARTYLTQPTRPPRVKASDETFHGSNDSDYGIAVVQKG